MHADRIWFWSLVVAVLFVAVRLATAAQAGIPSKIVGDGRFDIKASWVSNTTLFAAILGAAMKDVAAASILTGLNVLFLGLGALAVVVQLANVKNVKVGQKDQHELPLAAYLVAVVVSLWAAAGQLATLAAISIAAASTSAPGETGAAAAKGAGSAVEKMSGGTMILIVILTVITAYVVGTYAWKVMRAHLFPPPTPTAGLTDDAQAFARSWTVL